MDLWIPDVPAPGEAVLAIDPGLVTGVALWVPGAEAKFGQIEGQMPFLKQADEAIFRYRPTIVVESYTITARTTSLSRQYEPLEIIGALRWFSEEYSVPFRMQSPAQAKAFADNGKLESLGWYTATKGGHAADAARHLLTFLATDRKDRDVLEKLVAALD